MCRHNVAPDQSSVCLSVSRQFSDLKAVFMLLPKWLALLKTDLAHSGRSRKRQRSVSKTISSEVLAPRVLLSAVNPLPLSSLNGSNGFRLDGIDADDAVRLLGEQRRGRERGRLRRSDHWSSPGDAGGSSTAVRATWCSGSRVVSLRPSTCRR